MVLQKLGIKDEAIEALYNALRSSIATDDASSISVTLSRHFLVNCLVDYNKIDEAEKALDDWHNKECDGRWMLNYSAAKMYFKSKNIEKYIECVEKTYLDAPKEKWASINDIKLEIEE